MNKLNRALRWASLASGQETVPIATTPRTAIYERDRMVVYHYKQDRPTQKIPILLIYSLINRPSVLDLRPGRALKVAIIAAAPYAILADRTAGAALGAAMGSLPDDLAGATMLGDTGANAAGALVGAAVVARTGPVGRALVLGTLAGLTLASERVSFTTVIESTPVLRELDAWGRR